MPRQNAADPLSASAAVSPSAAAAPQAPSQPLSPTAAAPQAPSMPAALSPGAGAAPQPASPSALDSDLPEEVGADQGGASQPVPADLGKLDSATLARLARSLGVDAPTLWYDPDQQQPLNSAAENAQSVDAGALYAELQRRSDAGDKDARQALAMARLRGDPRAEPAAAAASDSGTAQALGLSPPAAALEGLQALSAVAQALGLSPGAGVTQTAAPAR
jgi:hypothetical protein